MEAQSKPLICITGINGYLGSWVCKYALQDGQYRVRGTVRNVKDTERLQPIKEEFGDLWDQLELVQADLLDTESLRQAIKECSYVIHVACPVPLHQPDDEDEVIKPSVEGTKDIFMACQDEGVKRLIITSSISINEDFRYPTCDEETPYPLDQPWINAYRKAKIFADELVWDMVNDENNKLEVVSLLPGLIIGPIFIKSNFTSKEVIQMILTGKYPLWPNLHISCVDVRDCAEAHMRALTCKKNIKICLANGTKSILEMVEIIRGEFSQYGYWISNWGLNYWIAYLASFFSSDMALALQLWGRRTEIDNTRAIKELGLKFTPIDQTIITTAYSLIKQGYVIDRTNGNADDHISSLN
ncbi:unnamed protein product [Moneuplotes crassus]|uniref:NAD-dependent epimerase/dehydratase domain-containing protein n=1 Tax=Euplotes crassus TaxID=5936 RepID=A0AAD1XE62_EUPCR|nr:unnamed protein product [Moneuplotes crassus]